MKQLGRVIGSVLAVVLTVFSMQTLAETTATLAGRDFNHMTTGFPLLGGHATAACETCHVAGVFKGTAKTCDGCHSLGKRVVATPKSTSHIVTDAPCETCHFNTSTFLGARFNHGTAQPGQCMTCHNGRQSESRPRGHNSGNKAIKSCDQCHRTYAWLPASWNHAAAAGICSTCHISSPDVAPENRKPAGHAATSLKNTLECDACHNYTAWLPARFKHNTGAACSSCHATGMAAGKSAGHIATTEECSVCHTSTISWSGALGAMPTNHIPFNAGATCGNCHTGLAKVSVSLLHANSVGTYTCENCHITPTSPGNYTGNNQKTKRSHEGSSGNNCTTACHEHSSAASYGGW